MNQQGEEIPFVIDCKDVLLIEYQLKYLDEFHQLTWQPEIYELLPHWNVSKEQRADWMMNYEIPENKKFLSAVANGETVGDLRLRLGIILKETSQFIGWCCTGIKDELTEPNREIVYAISKDHRGKGYTTQAALGLIQYLFDCTDVVQLNAIALAHNIPSQRVIQKAGFERVGSILIDNEEYEHYMIRKEA